MCFSDDSAMLCTSSFVDYRSNCHPSGQRMHSSAAGAVWASTGTRHFALRYSSFVVNLRGNLLGDVLIVVYNDSKLLNRSKVCCLRQVFDVSAILLHRACERTSPFTDVTDNFFD